MFEVHRMALEKQLWNIVDALRGSFSCDDIKEYVLVLIFYKYLSEHLNKFADELLESDGVKFDALNEASAQDDEYLMLVSECAIEQLGYFLMPKELFHRIAEKGKNGGLVIDVLSDALKQIENSTVGRDSENDFNYVFEGLREALSRFSAGSLDSRKKNQLIVQVLTYLDEINFCVNDTEIDVLGDAYEYLIRQFSVSAGKGGSEFYTPPMVSKLLAKLVTSDKDYLGSVYDPACGSGSLLLQVAKEMRSKKGKVGSYYGQEKNTNTFNLARMNMLLQGVHYKKFDIQRGDTLDDPKHLNMRFDAVVANPPYSTPWNGDEKLSTDIRFDGYGALAPKSKADFAFIQHMYYQLNENGTMAVVLPHGVLFRGGAEGVIRQVLIEEKNCIDAVIGLPANIFYGTSIATCILVLKKNRKPKQSIQFIDASHLFESANRQNYLRDIHVDKIISSFLNRNNTKNFSFLASLEDVCNLKFNLSIRRYVDASPQRQYLEALKEQVQGYTPEIIFKHVLQATTYKKNFLIEGSEDNAILIPKSQGDVLLVSESDVKSPNNYFILILNEQTLLAKYLIQYLRSELGQAFLSDCVEISSTRSHYTLDALSNYLLAPIPPLNIQKSCIEAKNKVEEIRKKITRFESDIIFNPNLAKKVVYQLSSTTNFLDEANKKEALLRLIRNGENDVVEFKETFSFDINRNKNDKMYKPSKERHIETSSLKTIVGFLNASGGTLFIGVSDECKIMGVELEINQFHKNVLDGFLLHFKNSLKERIGEGFYPFIQSKVYDFNDRTVLVIECSPTNTPCFLDNTDLYVRTNPATDKLTGRKMWDYLSTKFIKKED